MHGSFPVCFRLRQLDLELFSVNLPPAQRYALTTAHAGCHQQPDNRTNPVGALAESGS